MPSQRQSSIELRSLRYLIAASEHGSFRKAALALDIQESSISRRIRDLEDDIGATLFLRHTGGVSLTLAGQRFLVHARRAISHLNEGQMKAAAIGRAEDGHLKIGVFSHLASGFLSDLFAAMTQSIPACMSTSSMRPLTIRSPRSGSLSWTGPLSSANRYARSAR